MRDGMQCCENVCKRSFLNYETIALPAELRRHYGEPNAVSNAIGFAKHRSRSHDAVIRVYDDEAGNDHITGDLIIVTLSAFSEPYVLEQTAVKSVIHL